MAEGSSGSSSEAAKKTFEATNNIQQVTSVDTIFKYNHTEQQEILSKKPWEKEWEINTNKFFYHHLSFSVHYFKDMKISALALLKMVMHARSGGRLEVMGLMLGKIDGPTMVVMDTFALPVEGTETRVNAQAAAYEYMSLYIESAKKVAIYYF